MIGTRSNVIRIQQNHIETVTESIKKVDIDIFESGVSDNELDVYNTEVITTSGTPIKLAFADKNTPIIHLRINVPEGFEIVKPNVGENLQPIYNPDGTQTMIPNCITLDKFNKYYAQKVVSEEDTYYLAIIRLASEGSHDVQLVLRKIKNDESEKDELRTYEWKFYTRKQTKITGTNTDVPTTAYRGALLNVTKLWLLSSKYDRVRKPDWAGFFDDRLRRYPMNDEGATQVQNDLKAAIKDKVQDIYISNVTATPLLVERGWDVGVTSIDMSTGVATDTSNSNAGLNFIISPDDEKAIKVKTVEGKS